MLRQWRFLLDKESTGAGAQQGITALNIQILEMLAINTVIEDSDGDEMPQDLLANEKEEILHQAQEMFTSKVQIRGLGR